MQTFFKSALTIALATAWFASLSAHATEGHEHHHGHHGAHVADGSVSKTQGATEVPPLRILYPQSGAKVGTQLAVVFETPGDIQRLTMSAPSVGTHLHIEADGISLMPVQNQLIRLGEGRYVFVFDLPVEPGERELRVFWSDGMHKPIDTSIRSVKVTAEDQ